MAYDLNREGKMDNRTRLSIAVVVFTIVFLLVSVV